MFKGGTWSRWLLVLIIVNGLSVGRVLWQEAHDTESDFDALTRRVDQRLTPLRAEPLPRQIGFPILSSFNRTEREAIRARAQYILAPHLIVDDATADVLIIDPLYTDRELAAPVAAERGPTVYRRGTQP